jgi:hypothetical protein
MNKVRFFLLWTIANVCLLLACGVKTSIVIPQPKHKGEITYFQAKSENREIKLSWKYNGDKPESFIILKKEAAFDENVCSTCPLHLKKYAILIPKQIKGKFSWKDKAIKFGYRYWYQVCAVFTEGEQICSKTVFISIKLDQSTKLNFNFSPQ